MLITNHVKNGKHSENIFMQSGLFKDEVGPGVLRSIQPFNKPVLYKNSKDRKIVTTEGALIDSVLAIWHSYRRHAW